jgi:hypothetical protein
MSKIIYPLTEAEEYDGTKVFNWIDSRYAWLENHYGIPPGSRCNRTGLIEWNSIDPVNGQLRNTISGELAKVSYEVIQVLRGAKSLFFSHHASLEHAQWVDNSYFSYQLLHYRSITSRYTNYFEVYFDVYSDTDAVMMKLAMS